MKCEICGSKKDVRLFTSAMGGKPYTECRKCFDRIRMMFGDTYTDAEVEEEWNRGKTKNESI